jgi:starch synthase
VKILFLTAEVAPYAKVGGLADVAGALPKALSQLGHEVRVVMPRYGQIDADRWGLCPGVEPFTVSLGGEYVQVSVLECIHAGVPIYFLDVAGMFRERAVVYGEADDSRRFLLFCAAALQLTQHLDWQPEIVHSNDWHTAIVPALRHHSGSAPFLETAATVFTIHNLAYQGVVARSALGNVAALLPEDVHDDWVNMMVLGLQSADVLTTVSPTYAREILTPEFGAGLDWLLRARQDRLYGVLNGIDYEVFNPETDPRIAANYNVEDLAGKQACKLALQEEAGFLSDPHTPILGLVGRLVDQKGTGLFAEAIERLLQETSIQVTLLGQGEPRYQSLLQRIEQQYPGQFRAWLAFDGILAEHIYAGADLFVMPSRYEPCGLGQLIAMRYGTVPVVRATGGLADTVQEGLPGDPRTGFVFWPYDVGALQDAIRRAVAAFGRREEWLQIVRNDMVTDHSWTRSAHAYLALYRQAIDLARA